MGKQWVRQEIKRDELQESIDKTIVWVSRNQQLAGGVAASVALAAAVAGLLIYRARANSNAAWDRLALAQETAYAGQMDSSMQQLKALAEQYPGSDAASYGLLFAGDLHYRKGQYKEAVESYSKALEAGQPKPALPLALGGMVMAQEGAQERPQAAASAQRFLEQYPDHFLAPQVHAALARCLGASGQADQAKTAQQKIVLQYPDTSFAAWAKSRLESPAAPPAKK